VSFVIGVLIGAALTVGVLFVWWVRATLSFGP
jgi:hypothetical protein